MEFRKTALTCALATLFALGGTAAAQDWGGQQGGGAQDAPPPEHQGAMPGADVDLSDDTIDEFVDAFVEVQKVNDEFAQRLENASDAEEAQALHQEAQQEMVEAVEATGMNVEEYNEVAMALQNDPELLDQVVQMAEERQ
ncbi:DUF4168 domain-containing protein [Ectothiorhodospira variabilis]|uniref:DUF4168 domain-containing protein n=1 Tax=Ectothiorhodospira variabilis TaxID=505694 RepID=UPI001EFC0583|nr:DUF4168 domain-containing protein [Ectothiorhodospira variabilis]MCG5494352.1 DUF4168 domain-containing protein [Ectothiorhodospira variabilis]MCG5504119.1 DUF4168 domain-containing protein [Ectothiorhodospira variabilis]MCG5507274.1 DUF4168 domain-containing protein [Ectothiorhodospira variabilis]